MLAQEQSFQQRGIPFRRIGSRVDYTGALQSLFRDMEIGEVNSEELRFRADNGRVPGTTLTY